MDCECGYCYHKAKNPQFSIRCASFSGIRKCELMLGHDGIHCSKDGTRWNDRACAKVPNTLEKIIFVSMSLFLNIKTLRTLNKHYTYRGDDEPEITRRLVNFDKYLKLCVKDSLITQDVYDEWMIFFKEDKHAYALYQNHVMNEVHEL